MVTVDPVRDTAGRLAGFVRGAHALRTEEPAELKRVTGAFGVSYTAATGPPGTVEVGHTSTLFTVDAGGAVVVQWSFGTTPGELAEDLRTLLAAQAGEGDRA